MEFIKNTYKWTLFGFAAFNVVLFWVFVISGKEISNLPTVLDSLTAADGVVALIAPIVTLVLSGILSADNKARIIYWRYFYPLPATRAFSHHAASDDRIDPNHLRANWGEFPTDPSDQNRLWYRIYNTVKTDPRIHAAHRDWLFSRDITSYAIVFLCIFLPVSLLYPTLTTPIYIYCLYLILQFLVLVIVARTYGNRFVCSVLALASQPDPLNT